VIRLVGAVVCATLLVVAGVVSRVRKGEPEEQLACAVHALDPEQRQRHGELSARLRRAIRGRSEIRDGYVFTVGESAMDWAALGEWAGLERLCCPFFRVVLRAQPRGAAVELELGGASGVKRFIQGELPVILAGG